MFRKSFSSDATYVEKCCENFQHHIQEIILQMADKKHVPWETTLEELLEMIDGENIDWWLTGSTALALRGVEVSPHDIDLITSENGALALGQLLQDSLFEPIIKTDSWICKVFGKAFLYSVIDIAGG